MKEGRSKWLFACLLAVGVPLLAGAPGCNPDGRPSPSQVATAAYSAANEGRYEEANRHLSPVVISLMTSSLAEPCGGLGGMWDRSTFDKSIREIEVLKEDLGDGEATVLLRLHLKDGSVEETSEYLVWRENRWKISLD